MHHLSCISASQEYQQTIRPLQEKICIKKANRFEGNCSSNDKIFETSHFTVFSLPLYSFPIVHFFTITEEKNNLCFICLSLWGVENEVQVILKASCGGSSREKSTGLRGSPCPSYCLRLSLKCIKQGTCIVTTLSVPNEPS